jgi:hypothetical protein
MKQPAIAHVYAEVDEIRHPSRLAWWLVAGTYYGYPKCCVHYFVSNAGIHEWSTAAQRKAAKNTGFIPCPCCAERVVSGEVKLKDLIVDRKAKKAFPRDSGDTKAIEEFADSLLQSYQEAAQ